MKAVDLGKVESMVVDRDHQIGSVLVKFLIGRDGTIRNVEATAGPNELRQEAVRVVTKSGQWIPAVGNGIKVESYKIQPMVFRLTGRE
jgi:protein TonB